MFDGSSVYAMPLAQAYISNRVTAEHGMPALLGDHASSWSCSFFDDYLRAGTFRFKRLQTL
jgi:hypothetical protein